MTRSWRRRFTALASSATHREHYSGTAGLAYMAG